MKIRNLTPYPHFPALLYDEQGREVLVVLIKASFRLSDGAPHTSALPFHLSDERTSSGAVKYPADLVPSKLGTDIVCNGNVYAPHGQAVEACTAELRVGDVRCAVRVVGRRWWRRVDRTWRISEPEPFRSVPLGMERAFGGPGDPCNPVGMGRIQDEQDPEGVELPQLELASEAEQIKQPHDQPRPAGFAALAPHWEPRRGHRGTFGPTWERTRAPLPPVDMSISFWNAAQITAPRPLLGGEAVELRHLTRDGWLTATLPRVTVRAVADGREVCPALDLVLLEPDVDRVSVTYRVTLDVSSCLDRRAPDIRLVEKRWVPLGQRWSA